MQNEPTNTPNHYDLKVIKQFLPSLKQKMGGKSAKKRKVKGMVSPQVCAICGAAFDDYKHKSKQCPPCDGQLKTCCGFTTMDGRYAFMTLDGLWKEIFKVGEIVEVDGKDMDDLSEKKIPKDWVEKLFKAQKQ